MEGARTGEVFRLLLEELVGEAETHEDLRRAQLEGVGVELVYPVVDVLDEVRVGARCLADVLGERLEALNLRLHDVDDSLQRGAVRLLRLGVEVEDVDVVGDRELARREGGQERRLARTVRPDEAVALRVVRAHQHHGLGARAAPLSRAAAWW